MELYIITAMLVEISLKYLDNQEFATICLLLYVSYNLFTDFHGCSIILFILFRIYIHTN